MMKTQEQVKVILSSTIIDVSKKTAKSKNRKSATVKQAAEKKAVIKETYHETYY